MKRDGLKQAFDHTKQFSLVLAVLMTIALTPGVDAKGAGEHPRRCLRCQSHSAARQTGPLDSSWKRPWRSCTALRKMPIKQETLITIL